MIKFKNKKARFSISLILIFIFSILHSGLIHGEASKGKIPEKMVGYSQVGSWTRDGWDYKRFLDILSGSGLNYTRIFGIVPWFGGIMPWHRERDGRYDLMRFNERYWERLVDYIKYANDKGIIVHFSLFDRCGMTDSDGWPGHPFNPENNINGVEAKRGWHTFTSEKFKDVQKNYVIRVAKALKDFSVIFEIANEPLDGLEWHKWVIDILKTEGLKDEVISLNIHTSDLQEFSSSSLWKSFHIKELPSSIRGGNFIYSDDGIELADSDAIYKWAKEVLDRGGSYEHLSAANDIRGIMPPVEVLKALSRAKYEKGTIRG